MDNSEEDFKLVHSIIENVKNVIVGKDKAIEMSVIALLCRGHLLIEDIPGVGKTTLVKSLALSTGCEFKRIQFTPDILPSDITGVFIYNQKTSEFEFRAGPILSHIVLADEINRATPKTQSALLEAMEERQTTVDGVTHKMPKPFMIMATQNPIDYEGTFPLPEAQLDRFLMCISLGYPEESEELEIMNRLSVDHPIDSLKKVIEPEEICALQEKIKDVYVDDLVCRYILSIVGATRTQPDVILGASPRASLSLYRASQALAFISGRDHALPDDVKGLAESVIAHRLLLTAQSRMSGVDGKQVVGKIVSEVSVPGAKAQGWLSS